MVESRPVMHYRPEHLARLSARLEELCAGVSGCGRGPLPPELADEIAATAGEVMVELAGHGRDELAGQVIAEARRLRAVARSAGAEPGRVAESGRALVSDLELVIRADRRAA